MTERQTLIAKIIRSNALTALEKRYIKRLIVADMEQTERKEGAAHVDEPHR